MAWCSGVKSGVKSGGLFLLLSLFMTTSHGSDLEECIAGADGLSGPELSDYYEACRLASIEDYVQEDEYEDSEQVETNEEAEVEAQSAP